MHAGSLSRKGLFGLLIILFIFSRQQPQRGAAEALDDAKGGLARPQQHGAGGHSAAGGDGGDPGARHLPAVRLAP